jgi:invasion protein IalB
MHRLICAGLLLAAFAPLPASAQSAVPDWQATCEADGCTLARRLIDQSTGRPVATFLAFVPKANANLSIGAALPLGTAIEAGVRMVAGDTTLEIPYQVCFPDGCRALRETSAEEVAALAAAEAIDIRFFPFSADRAVSVTMPLEGFTEAVAAARAELE